MYLFLIVLDFIRSLAIILANLPGKQNKKKRKLDENKTNKIIASSKIDANALEEIIIWKNVTTKLA